MLQMSSKMENFGYHSLRGSDLVTARMSNINSIDKAKKDALAGQGSSQDQTQMTSQFKGVNSLEQTATAELDTINTNNFNSKVNNSVYEEGVLPVLGNEAGFSNLQD